jgi:protein TonB
MTRQEPKVFAEVTTASRNVVSPETAPPIVHLEVSSLGPSSVSEDSRASPEAATTDGPSTVTVRTKPRYRYNPEPTYPPMARRRHQEGMVLLNVLVTSEGGAAEVRVVKSSGYTLLDEAARNAVRRWTFEPGRLGRIPVSSEIQVPIQFKLVGQ